MVANPERGEVDLPVNGDVFVLKLSMNAAVILQKKTGKTIGQLLQACGELDFDAIRHVTWMLLQKYHADRFRQLEAVGDLIDEAGGVQKVADALIQVQQVNRAEGPVVRGADGRPPDAQIGPTGDGFMSKPDASV
jgi:hypothetical protein